MVIKELALPVSASHLTHEIASSEDYAFCRQIMRKASRNYSFASNVLPSDKLFHVEALYAFLRVGDDRVDVSHEGFESKQAAIDDWENLYWSAWDTGDSPHPVMRAYLNTALIHGIPSSVMTTYFRAMKEDLTRTRFATFDDLLHYMDGSTVPVGRGMTYILGTRDGHTINDALPGADALSIAMQLSNFWRDIGEDYELINRIYLPQEDMDRFGYVETDLANQQINQNLVSLLEFQFERTEKYYNHARESVTLLADGRWAVMSGLEIYRAIIGSIRRNQYDVFSKRASASTIRKTGLLLRAFLTTSVLKAG